MNKLIKQPYHLTCSRNYYNIHEQRILLKVLEKLQNEMVFKKNPISVLEKLESGITLKFKVRDLMISGSKNYVSIRNSLDALMDKDIEMRGCEKNKGCFFIKSKLLTEYKYYFNNEFVDVTIGKSVLAYLLSLSSYTRYSINVAFNTQSPYTSRIYQYVSHWRDKNDGFIINLKVDVIKEILSLGDKYKRASSIRQMILSPAIKELEEKADIWFSIKEPIKEVRKVVGWKIQIHKRSEARAKELQVTTGHANLLESSKKKTGLSAKKSRKREPSLEEIEVSRNKFLESLKKQEETQTISYKKYASKFRNKK